MCTFPYRSIVEFSTREEALRAITELNERQLMGRPVYLREVSLNLSGDISRMHLHFVVSFHRIAKMMPDMALLPYPVVQASQEHLT